MPPFKRLQPKNSQTANRSELFRPSDELLLIRPAFESVTDGTYRFNLNAAKVIEAGGKKMLRVSGDFFDDNGGCLEESFLVAPDWKAGSPFRSLLEATGTLPEKGEPFRPEQMVGQELLLTMKVVTSGDKEYLNLVSAEMPEDEFEGPYEEELGLE